MVEQLESFSSLEKGSFGGLKSHLWLAGADAERIAQTLMCGGVSQHDTPAAAAAASRPRFFPSALLHLHQMPGPL